MATKAASVPIRQNHKTECRERASQTPEDQSGEQRQASRQQPASMCNHRICLSSRLAGRQLHRPKREGGDRKHPDKCDGGRYDRQRSFQEATDLRAVFAGKHHHSPLAERRGWAGLRSKQPSPIGALFNLARRTTVTAARPRGALYRPMGSSPAILVPKARRDWDTHPAH